MGAHQSRDQAPPAPRRLTLLSASTLLFALLAGIYVANGDFLPTADAKASAYLPISLLREGDLSFTPREMPFMFTWRMAEAGGWRRIEIKRWDRARIDGKSFEEHLQSGRLQRLHSRYYIVPSTRQGQWVNSFGPGPGLVALPFFALADLLTPQLEYDVEAIWTTTKLAASCFAAASALFLFLAIPRFAPLPRAWLLALVYGLGTGTWSTSSQQLWQHGPNQLFLALGFWLLLRRARCPASAALCGLALAAAVACRPTSIFFFAAVATTLALSRRRTLLLPFLLGALPLAAVLAAYNAWYHGSPFVFAQQVAGHLIAQDKTGSPEIWQTPLLHGAAGMLLSPSRGLFVYSPFLLLALPGFVTVWRHPRWAPLRMLSLALVAVWLLEFKHFDWWGGWSFGYRHLVDTTLVLCLLILPSLHWLRARRRRLALAASLAAWSIAVQAIGAFLYCMVGWNNRLDSCQLRLLPQDRIVTMHDEAHAATLVASGQAQLIKTQRLNIDNPQHRHRLWSLRDSQLLYYLKHPAHSRRTKRQLMDRWLAQR